MESKIQDLIQKTLQNYAKEKKLNLPNPIDFDITVPKESSHGDFSTNVAFKLSRVAKNKPKGIAEDFLPFLNETWIDRVEVAGAGFINFYLKKTSLAQVLIEALEHDQKFGESDYGKDKSILMEYVSANPTGPLTIAHGRQAAVGDSLSRILKKTGHHVDREFYLNDAGRQIRLLGQSVFTRYMEAFEMKEPFPEDGYKGAYIKDIAQEIINLKRDSC